MAIKAAFAVPHPPLIIPAVGRGQEGCIQATVDAYKQVARQIAQLAPATVIVTSPHAPMYRDAFYVCEGARATGNMGMFGAAQESMTLNYDADLAAALTGIAREAGLPIAANDPDDDFLDHATFIPLWFLDRALEELGRTPGSYQLVRIGISGLGFEAHRTMGACLAQAAMSCGRDCVIIASGDLSHVLKEDGPYGFKPQGPEFDAQIEEIFTSGNLEALFGFDQAFCEDAAECGLRSFQIMAAALTASAPADAWESRLLSHEGPFGVGYAVASFLPAAASGVTETAAAPAPDPYAALARAALTHCVEHGELLPLPADLPAEMTSTQAGAL